MADNQVNTFLRAAYECDIDTVLKLLREGMPVDISNQNGLQAIHFAAKKGNVELADELVKKGALVNAPTAKGNTPLHIASLAGHSEVVKLLLRHGAEVNLQSECFSDVFTPLYMAAQIGNQEVVMLLLAHGADPTLHTKNGSSPRDVALQQGFKAVAELLEEYEKRTKGGKTIESPSDDDQSEASVEGATGLTDELKKKLGPPPMCQDMTASPKNSPKKFPRKVQEVSAVNGEDSS